MPRRINPCYLLGGIVIFCCLTVYLPILLNLKPVDDRYRFVNPDIKFYIQPDNLTTLIDLQEPCGIDEPFLLVVVCSAVQNHYVRKTIRETWGSYLNKDPSQVRVIFLLGTTTEKVQNDRLDAESNQYGDIVQEDFLDAYDNLTLKSVMMLKWTTGNCPGAKYVMKTDDDTFVNIKKLLTYLRHLNKPRVLAGCLICGAVPLKDRKSKWYAPSSLFSERIYPDYLSGTGYVISGDLVTDLYATALETPFFNLEDIYITGICSRKLKVKPIDYEGFSYLKRKFHPCLFQQIITSHQTTPKEMHSYWANISSPRVKCGNQTLQLRPEYKPRNCH